jgi:hypothetical protein
MNLRLIDGVLHLAGMGRRIAFSERYSHLLAGFKMPAPTRASAFETTIYEVLA